VWERATCKHFRVPLLQDEEIPKEVTVTDMYRENQSFCVYMPAK